MEDIIKQRVDRLQHELNQSGDEMLAQAAIDLSDAHRRIVNKTAMTLSCAIDLLIKKNRHDAVIKRIVHEWPLKFDARDRHLEQHVRRASADYGVDTGISDIDLWADDTSSYMIIDWILAAIDETNIKTFHPTVDALKRLRRQDYEPKLPQITWQTTHMESPITIGRHSISAIYAADQDIDMGLSRKSMAIDAGKTHQDLIVGWTELPKRPGETANRLFIKDGTQVRLLAPGRSVQLDLPMDGARSIHDATIHTLRQLQGWKGLRNWAALQRLLSIEGERMGWVRWTMDDHMIALGYGQRAKDDTAKRDDIAKQIEMLTQIELEVFDKHGNTIDQHPVLLVAKRTKKIKDSKYKLDGMVLQLNPLLYQGVRNSKTKKVGNKWLPAPIDIARINHTKHPYAIALGMILPIRWRWRLWEGKEHVALTGNNLLQLAGIKIQKANPERAWKALKRDLDKLKEIGGLGKYTWKDKDAQWTADNVCYLYPPNWVVDRAIFKIHPDEKKKLPPPVTGVDLKQWREQNGLTQIQAAKKIGVNISSIQRSEKHADKKIGPSIRKKFDQIVQEYTTNTVTLLDKNRTEITI